MPRLSDTELLARLVAFDTTSANTNLPLIDFVCEYLDGTGARIHRMPSDDGVKANLAVVAGPDPDGRGGEADRGGLTLSGHTDVVPALERGWSSDPFEATAADGTIVGRGTADMKGFLALAIQTLAESDRRTLARPLALLFTYDEEIGTRGARMLFDSGGPPEPLPRRTIVGEPTSLTPARLHKGHLRARIVIEGRAAHSGLPHLGRSAIEPAARVVSALAELRRVLEAERPAGADAFPQVPFVTLNVGRIDGGAAANVVPDRCALELGARLLPGMDSRDFLARVREAVDRAAGDAPWRLEVAAESPPAMLDQGSDLWEWLRFESAIPNPRASSCLESVAFATDAGWLQRLGFECVVWGPGSIEVAHRANEFVPLSDLAAARAMLARAVDRWCAGTG
ncbi:MAG TPA: acetylornithine deacetylase [Gemmatimonadota bacterium]|nr:acetylornithine deacetylase [Gemmatimonadota bacterium]